MKEERALGTGDPSFPKMIWPPKQLCPSCYLSQSRKSSGTVQIDWNRDEVFTFLVRYYGKTLVSSYTDEDLIKIRKDESAADDIATHAVAVPLGAALAIALASCAFGALASFWRTQQKNRKYIHQLHSLKTIWFCRRVIIRGIDSRERGFPFISFLWLFFPVLMFQAKEELEQN